MRMNEAEKKAAALPAEVDGADDSVLPAGAVRSSFSGRPASRSRRCSNPEAPPLAHDPEKARPNRPCRGKFPAAGLQQGFGTHDRSRITLPGWQGSIAAETASLSQHRKSRPATLEICQIVRRRPSERPLGHRNGSEMTVDHQREAVRRRHVCSLNVSRLGLVD